MNTRMGRYIIRVRGADSAEPIRAALSREPHVSIVDHTARMVLVDGDESDLRRALSRFPGAVLIREDHYGRPDTRPKLGR